MIRRIYSDNYKSLVNFELQLQELTLLLGPNGVGKTAILDVVFGLRRLLSGEAKVTDVELFPRPR
jgi:ABC-type multidrug transport system ATPase subunit